MPELHTLAIFAVACLALTATPGPDMLLIMSRTVSQGRSAGFASLAGILVGTYCHALAAALGLSELFLLVPVAYDIVRYVGAAYLLYLAWQAFRAPAMGVGLSDSLPRYPVGRMFRQGLLTNLLNPKMALFVLALFPQFVHPEAGSVALQIMLFATLLNLIGLVVNGGVIMMAGRIGSKLARNNRFRRTSQVFLGAVFTGLAARLAFEGKQ